MGTLSAMDMLNHTPSIDMALHWHLRSNHYPPVPEGHVYTAQWALDHGVEAILFEDDSLWREEIGLVGPSKVVTVADIIEGLHLDTFLDRLVYEALQEEAADHE